MSTNFDVADQYLNFVRIPSLILEAVTFRQTDRQTDNGGK
jgi:hypothetical protein